MKYLQTYENHIDDYYKKSDDDKATTLLWVKFKDRVKRDIEDYMRYKSDVNAYLDNKTKKLDLAILSETEKELPEEKKAKLKKEWKDKYPQFIKK